MYFLLGNRYRLHVTMAIESRYPSLADGDDVWARIQRIGTVGVWYGLYGMDADYDPTTAKTVIISELGV